MLKDIEACASLIQRFLLALPSYCREIQCRLSCIALVGYHEEGERVGHFVIVLYRVALRVIF